MKDLSHLCSQSSKTAWAAACLALSACVAAAQPAITGIYPDGARQFEPASALSFTASSAAGITNVTVNLTGGKIGHTAYLKKLTLSSGLSVSGSAQSENVSAALSTNWLYSATITVQDASGQSASTTFKFDTIIPSYSWEAEDWDYNGGAYHDNPQTNAYANAAAVSGQDCNHSSTSGGGAYRPLGLSTEGASDIPRLPYIGSGLSDYDVGFNNGQDWANYTRHYPAGTYNVYMRGSDGGGQAADSASISVVSGSAHFNGSGPYTFSVPALGGWQAYSFVQLKDSSGNPAQLVTDGSATGLQVATDQGSYNANFYILVPADTNTSAASSVAFSAIYPDGLFQFEPTNFFTITATSPVAILPGDISVQLTISNLTGGGSVISVSPGDGLTATATAGGWILNVPLTSNATYNAVVQVSDANGVPGLTNIIFDTITPAYTFEAEDWDYDNGSFNQFFDNPQVDAYDSTASTEGIDFSCLNNVHSYAYRGGVEMGFGLNTEGNGDVPRSQYNGKPDYDVGFTGGGNWGDYTRNYPAGTYNMYCRLADGNGFTSDAGSVYLVTGGLKTSSQTLSKLGTYNVAGTGGWQKYAFFPVLNAGGALARFAGGSLETLRVTVDGGNQNQNYFMLMPAVQTFNPPFVSAFQPDGSGLFQYTNQLSFTVNSDAGISTNSIVLNLDGAVVHGFGVSGNANTWDITYPVSLNSYHTAIITLTDSVGITKSTNGFGTFTATDYQWEAEDFDYSGGHYYDNPQVDSYNGQSGISGVDFVEADANPTEPFVYRPSPDVPTESADAAGDGVRSQFGGSAVNYNIGFFGGGSWANYTRHYPAGTYNIVGRFAEGANTAYAQISQVTSGLGTTNQATTLLGTFTVPSMGWGTWEWSTLMDATGHPAKVYVDGSETTLRFSGYAPNGEPECNIDFFMLTPTTPSPKLTPTVNGNTISVSFQTDANYKYQLVYKNHLGDPTWQPVGSVVPGNGAVQPAQDTVVGAARFYQVQVTAK